MSLANWDVMQIGRHFYLVNRTILSVHCFIIHVIISSVGVLAVEAKIAKSPN